MSPQEAYLKCYNENRRILELEKFIISDSGFCVDYVRNIIKEPWKEGEEIISKHAQSSLLYASEIIKGKWEKGEKIISTVAFYSYHYSYLINESFPLGHTVIFNSYFKNDYINFLKSINYDLSEISEWLI
jgi:lambda repressor-like predicted transcriptional regulator